jgi:hypothetical protein
MRKLIILWAWLPALCFAVLAVGALVALAVLSPNSPNSHQDTRPPVISDIIIRSISDNVAEVSWRTDEPATTKITWSPENGGFNAGGEFVNVGPLGHRILSTSHTILIDDLQPNTEYVIRLISADAAGNEAIFAGLGYTTQRIWPSSP